MKSSYIHLQKRQDIPFLEHWSARWQMRCVSTFLKYTENYFILKSVIKMQSFKMWNWTSCFWVLLSATFFLSEILYIFMYIYIQFPYFLCIVWIMEPFFCRKENNICSLRWPELWKVEIKLPHFLKRSLICWTAITEISACNAVKCGVWQYVNKA